MVSHEFRTPLTVIDGRTGQIMRRLDTMAPDDVRARLASIRVSIAHLVKLIESVLSGAQLEEGKIVFEPVRVDLAGMLDEAGVAARERFPDHRVTVSLPDHGRHIQCDPTLIRQVIGNLVGNAGRYTAPGGSIEIGLRHETGEDAVRISVRDTGFGIPKDEMPRLFERFFRARTSAGRPGTGTGLHLVQQFVALHGGPCEVESVEGKGSCFQVILPASQRNTPPPSAPEPSGNAAELLKAVQTTKNDIAMRA